MISYQMEADKKKTLGPAVHDIVLYMEGMLVVVHVAVHRHLHQEETDMGRDDLSQSCDHPGKGRIISGKYHSGNHSLETKTKNSIKMIVLKNMKNCSVNTEI